MDIDPIHPRAVMGPPPTPDRTGCELRRRKALLRQRGVALLMTMLALAMAMILVMGFVTSQSTSVGLGRNVNNQAVARAIAESGLNTAISRIQKNATWRTDQASGVWVNAQPFSSGTLTVKGEDGTFNLSTFAVTGSGSLTTSNLNPLALTAVGTYGNVTHTLRAQLTFTGGSGTPPTNGMVAWFSADTLSGSSIATWADQATGGGHTATADLSGRPTLVTSGIGLPAGTAALRFANKKDELRTVKAIGIGPTDPFCYWLVIRADTGYANGNMGDGSGSYFLDRTLSGGGNPLVSLKAVGGKWAYQSRYDDGSNLAGPISTSAISTSTFTLLALRRVYKTNFELWVNGKRESTIVDSGKNLTPDAPNIACHGTITSGGAPSYIAEIIIYKNQASATEFQAAGSYLATKYGLTTSFPAGSSGGAINVAALRLEQP